MLQRMSLGSEEQGLNLIDLIPSSVQVEMAKHWKDKDTSGIKDFKQVTETSDWTYSTGYKGTVKPLSQSAQNIFDSTGLQLIVAKEPKVGGLSVAPTEEQIPY